MRRYLSADTLRFAVHERKPAACAEGNGKSIVFCGELIDVGVPVVLWNQQSKYPHAPKIKGSPLSGFVKRGVAPYLSFYTPKMNDAWDFAPSEIAVRMARRPLGAKDAPWEPLDEDAATLRALWDRCGLAYSAGATTVRKEEGKRKKGAKAKYEYQERAYQLSGYLPRSTRWAGLAGTEGSHLPYPFETRVRYPVELDGVTVQVYDTIVDRAHESFRNFDGRGKSFVEAARNVVKQFTQHHDAVGDALSLYRGMQKGGNSVHFMLDYDGTIYQTCDLANQTGHIADFNPFSVGVEICHYCYFQGISVVLADGKPLALPAKFTGIKAPFPFSDAALAAALEDHLKTEYGIEGVDIGHGRTYFPIQIDRAPRLGHPDRLRANGFVKGSVVSAKGTMAGLIFDYSEAQHEAARALVRGVCEAFEARFADGRAISGIPKICAPGDASVDWYGFNFTHAKKDVGAFRGIVGHVTVTHGGKWDPNWAYRWDALEASLKGEALPKMPETAVVPFVPTGAHAKAEAKKVRKVPGRPPPRPPGASGKLRPASAPGARARDDGVETSKAIIATVQTLLAVLHARGLIDVGPTDVTGSVDESTIRAADAFAVKIGLPARGLITGEIRRRLWAFYRENVSAPGSAEG
ncbi:MAG TPA: N-acetylmuramoyl-L-alanine amidase [Myxococcota bacterium]|jgi:N-acetyl-anhydromuramyl-L-alanine amidase AmpD|nr:N-acetylmuramoyl-L-alanine amidase [Myxococcota bacterium]